MQDFVDRQFFNLTVFTLIFGVIFYDIIAALGFTYVDEICALLLLALFMYSVLKNKTWEFDRSFLYLIAVFIFYLIYSFVISSNTTGAIITDFIIQAKPYLAFFCVYAIRPKLSDSQKLIIRQLIVLCSLFLFVVGVGGLVVWDVIDYTFKHPSRLATASSILALLYLYCSDYTKNDKIIFVIILAIGILSGRSKHYGFFALCMLSVFYFIHSDRMRFNVRNTIFFCVVLTLSVIVAWDKIYFYFVTGGFGSGRAVNELYARFALYYFSIQVLLDYIPFGSGFASFATFASGESYSPIYEKYGMHNMHGLSKHDPEFISDTYFPALAQFGFVGIVLFFYFWINLFKWAVRAYLKGYIKEAILSIMIIVFFIIECTSDSTLTHNRGMFMMMMLGLLFSDIKTREADEDTVSK